MLQKAFLCEVGPIKVAKGEAIAADVEVARDSGRLQGQILI